jgi:hypothetical protein
MPPGGRGVSDRGRWWRCLTYNAYFFGLHTRRGSVMVHFGQYFPGIRGLLVNSNTSSFPGKYR